jgi:hypothetical protein
MNLDHQAMAIAVAEHLRDLDGRGWQEVPESEYDRAYRSKFTDGIITLTICVTGRCEREQKWHIDYWCGVEPPDRPGIRDYTTDIRCALSKTPLQIAKDIIRRLLPDARKIEAEATRRRENRLADEAATDNLAQIVALAFDAPVCKRKRGHIDLGYRSHRPYGDIEVSTYDYPHAELSLKKVPVELASQIGKLWTDWHRSHYPSPPTWLREDCVVQVKSFANRIGRVAYIDDDTGDVHVNFGDELDPNTIETTADDLTQVKG